MADQNSDHIQNPNDQDNSRKRRNSTSNGDDSQISHKRTHSIHEEHFLTRLCLNSNSPQNPPNIRPQSPSYHYLVDSQPVPFPVNGDLPATSSYMTTDQYINNIPIAPPIQRREVAVPRSRPARGRRGHSQAPREENNNNNNAFPPPYPWATNKRATVHTLTELKERKIETITGLVRCRKCEKEYEMSFNLVEKFKEIGSFVAKNKDSMHDRAPSVWTSPILPTCEFCKQEHSVKPVISGKKKTVNWLFLLLGQFLGCCTLAQLKYFCKHTGNHRTGAKDRVLYLTYLGLCDQLVPSGPFQRLQN